METKKRKEEADERKKPETENKTPSSVIFVERTEKGELASILREKEKELNKVGKKKVKIVEKNGDQLSQVLTSSNPWGEERCTRQDCQSCRNSCKETGKCRDRNVVYETKCKECKVKGETTTYVGETARSERQREHMSDCLSTKTKSHMRDHWEERHREKGRELRTLDDVVETYKVKVLEKYRTSLQRQKGEAIHIRRATGTILNDKEEFNCCKLPKLSDSKQKQKVAVTTRDRDIGEETDRFQEERPEIQFKRRERPEEETEVNINYVEEKDENQRQRKQRKISRYPYR